MANTSVIRTAFVMNNQTYLAASNAASTLITIYRVTVNESSSAVQLQFVQSFSVANCFSATFFTFRSNSYLALPLYLYGVGSPIYLFNTTLGQFQLLQTLPTTGITKFVFTAMNSTTAYLASCTRFDGALNSRNSVSLIFKFNTVSSTFQLFQNVSTSGATSVTFFTMANSTYVVFANFNDGVSVSVNSQILKFNGNTFASFQSIPTVCANGWEYFEINGASFLALTQAYQDSVQLNYRIDSRIFKYNTTLASFQPLQNLPTFGAAGFTFFNINGGSFLFVANNGDGSSVMYVDSKVYRYDTLSQTFLEYQSLSFLGGMSGPWDRFAINGVDYFTANAQIYAWKKCFVV